MIHKINEDPLDRMRFPVEEWRFVETEYNVNDLGTTETLFAVGNGFVGMRGNPEEGRDCYQHGTFVNGFHETWRINHAEDAFGFAETGQTIINVPDSKIIKIYVDGEPLLLSIADLEHYERALDFREGKLTRELLWRTPAGKRVRVSSSRMVSFTDRSIVIYDVEVELLDGDAPIVLSSQIVNRQVGGAEQRDDNPAGFDPRRANTFNWRVLEPQASWVSGNRMLLGYKAANSGMTIAVGADHYFETENGYEVSTTSDQDMAKAVFRVEAKQGKPVRLRKAAAYHVSRSVPASELADRARRNLDRVRDLGFTHFETQQRDYLANFWEHADVRIGGQPGIQQAVRWCLFQLLQAAARSDQLGIAAKGVSGSGYEGHYFWDTEIYLVPFLTYTMPNVARNALRFRSNTLPKARERAAVMSLKGALYPWRTINGEEASAYYAAGTAQFHIDADVAFAFAKYGNVSGDTQFLYRDGAAVLVETARMWADLGFWRTEYDDRERFHIHGVTGPDEYTTVVNNNTYTNVMAQANLRNAAQLLREMEENDPEAFERARASLHFTEEEIREWERCAENMVILWDETLGIHPQDDKFLESEMWDLENTPVSKRPLLLHFHPLVIYRFQVLKQADVVLALFLQGHLFTDAEKKADFEYYDPITTGDSSLSGVVQALLAAEVGYQEMAMNYFLSGLYVDLANLHSNARDGVHIASTGGVWNALVYGFGGMRDHGGWLTFDPRLPESWDSLSYQLCVRGSKLAVELVRESITFRLLEGDPVSVTVRGQECTVTPAGPVVVALENQGPNLPSLEPGHPVIGREREDGSVIQAIVPEAAAN